MTEDDWKTPGWRLTERLAAACAEEAEANPEMVPTYLSVPSRGDLPLYFRRIFDPQDPTREKPLQFRMGSRDGLFPAREEPVHTVNLSSGFYMGVFPVTVGQYGPCEDQAKALLPRNEIDFESAEEFCTWLNKQGTLPKGFRAALPSEAQWEYSCRAGSKTEYCNGDGEAALSEVGWFDKGWGDGPFQVGGKNPNECGIYDMHGNLREWCRDFWKENVYRSRPDGVLDPVVMEGDSSSSDRVLRGGSWFDSAWGCRSAFRRRGGGGVRRWDFGFRVGLLNSQETGRGAP